MFDVITILAQESAGDFFGFILGLGFMVGIVWLIVKAVGPPPQVGPATGADRDVLATADELDPENPWLAKVLTMPAYGQVPQGIAHLMREASVEHDEKVFGAVATKHGRWKGGYLVATTSYVRFIQTRIVKHDEFFPYSWPVERVQSIGSRNVVEVGNYLFQVRSARKAKEFVEMHKALLQAHNWSSSRDAQISAAAAQQTIEGSTAAELERLAALHADGTLSDEEFAQAKRRLLG